MLTFIIGTVILALFYGLAWHNQPARELEHTQNSPLQESAKPGACGHAHTKQTL